MQYCQLIRRGLGFWFGINRPLAVQGSEDLDITVKDCVGPPKAFLIPVERSFARLPCFTVQFFKKRMKLSKSRSVCFDRLFHNSSRMIDKSIFEKSYDSQILKR